MRFSLSAPLPSVRGCALNKSRRWQLYFSLQLQAVILFRVVGNRKHHRCSGKLIHAAELAVGWA